MADTAVSDEELFRRYQNGDEHALDLLVRAYEPRIRGFLRKRLGPDEQIADLTQDTFLRIHRARHTFDPDRKFSTWIHTIANNLLKNEFRNRRRRRETLFSEIPPPTGSTTHPLLDVASPRPDPSHQTYCGELRCAIRTAIDRMDPHHRDPFVMREIEDRTYEEIAQHAGVPVGTVKSRLHRARSSFLACLPVPV